MSESYTMVTTLYNDEEIRQVTGEGSFSDDDSSIIRNVVTVYPDVQYQQFQGFGAAMTEAAGSVINALPAEISDELLSDCFGSGGLGYSWVRTHIDSCDFSLSTYSSCILENGSAAIDAESFREHDRQYIMPNIRKVNEQLRREGREELKLYLVPWSPPAGMKDNRQRHGGGRLLPQYREVWAQYLCRYIEAYEREGFHVAVIGVQNEPNAVQTWDSCLWSSQEERDFIHSYLLPALREAEITDVKITVWDHNRERAFERVREVCSNGVEDEVGAVSFHWYSGDHFENVSMVYAEYPDYLLIFSEGCIEFAHFSEAAALQHARMYGHHIIGDLNHGMQVWLDWNIALDTSGGPNHVQNLCAAPIMVDTKNGKYEKQLSYYYIGHFSRYIRPGAYRIGCSAFSSELEMTAWKNPDSSVVLVIMNSAGQDHSLYLRIAGKSAHVTIQADSINTVII